MIISIILLAFLLRLIGLEQSYWLDEAIGVLEVHKHSFPGLIDGFLKVDNHTPLYYFFLELWTFIFGYSEVAVRMLSVFFGLGTIYITYIFSRKLFPQHKSIALVTSLVLATSQFHIYYSQEARMYSQAAFFAILSVYSFFMVLQKPKARLYWLTFSLSLAALIFTDYMPAFLWPVFPIVGLFKRRPLTWWKWFVLSQVPLAILSIVWAPLLLIQISNYSTTLKSFSQWSSVAGGANIKNIMLLWIKFAFGRISLLDKKLYYSLVIASSLPLVTGVIFFRKLYKKNILIVSWLVVPIILGILASAFFPAFNYFRYVYIYPAFCILVVSGIYQLKSARLQTALVTLIITFNLVGVGIYYFDQSQQREQWRQAVNYIETNSLEGDIVLFEFPEPFAPYRWYEQDKVLSEGATNSISADPKLTRQRTSDLIKGKIRAFHFEYLRDLSDSARVVEATLKEHNFQVTRETADFVGVGKITLWEKIE